MTTMPGSEQSGRTLILLLVGGLLVGVAIGILLFGGSFGEQGTTVSNEETLGTIAEAEAAPIVGAPAPDFTLVDAVTGEQVQLSDLRGKPVVVNFWATWCGPCRIEMPAIQQAFDDNDDLVILAVNNQESAQEVVDFAQELGLTFNLLLDEDGSIQSTYRVRAYPSTYFVNRDGTVNAVQIGVMTEQQLAEQIAPILE